MKNTLAYFVRTTRWLVRLGDFNIKDPSDDLYVQVKGATTLFITTLSLMTFTITLSINN